MSPAALASHRLAALAAAVCRDAEALEAHARVAAQLDADWVVRSLDPAQRAWAAMTIHAWYTALETCVERVVRQLDGEVPSGPDGHRRLLEQAALAIPPTRPALLPSVADRALHELLAFRHFFRNAYAVELDATRLAENLRRLSSVHAAVRAHLEAVAAFLDAAAASASARS